MATPAIPAMPMTAAAAPAAGVAPQATALQAAAMPTSAPVSPGVDEEALVFDAGGAALVGVLSRPAVGDPTASRRLGVVIVVGGPQYRVGSHRQFVQMARALAHGGHTALRFDARGMGDGDGTARGFETLDDDIAAALQALRRHAPALQGAVLLGLCDGASAALLYLQRRADPFVRGLVLLNPWVRSAATHAATQVKHYYADRLRSPAFWRKLLGGGVKWSAAGELIASVRAMRAGRTARAGDTRADGLQAALLPGAPFQDGMAVAWRAFSHPMLLLLSGSDYVAREFEEAVAASAAWAGALQRDGLTVQRLSGADHTLSDPEHSRAAEQSVLAWLASADTIDRS